MKMQLLILSAVGLTACSQTNYYCTKEQDKKVVAYAEGCAVYPKTSKEKRMCYRFATRKYCETKHTKWVKNHPANKEQ